MPSAGADVTVPNIVMFFLWVFNTGGNTGSYVGGLPKLYHKCVT
jgi:hypothetical protein